MFLQLDKYNCVYVNDLCFQYIFMFPQLDKYNCVYVNDLQ